MTRFALTFLVTLIASGSATNDVFAFEPGTTVQNVLNQLRDDPKATFSTLKGWNMVKVETEIEVSIYFFTPEQHSAHPTVVRRRIYERDEHVWTETTAICDAAKLTCENLFNEFVRLGNEVQHQTK